MEIIDAKGKLHDRQILNVLSHSMYMPTEEKLNILADKYESDPAIHAFSCIENASVAGVIVLKHHINRTFEIRSIAVAEASRGRGVGAKLIAHAIGELKCGELSAETDDDAVGFYRSCGFDIVSLGEKYPGVVRYLCTLKVV